MKFDFLIFQELKVEEEIGAWQFAGKREEDEKTATREQDKRRSNETRLVGRQLQLQLLGQPAPSSGHF